jgi:serine/threonine protein kinase
VQLDYLQSQLDIRIGQISEAGRKQHNEDAIGIRIPSGSLLASKGIVAIVADGVSAAEAGKEASELSVHSFISDYFSTHDAWSVKTSGGKVLTALNRWLYGRGQNYPNAEKGYITTFSALILKSSSAYIFHVGDSRIYRLRNGDLEQLTRDHTTPAGNGQRYLARALGIDPRLEIDYQEMTLIKGDRFLLTTDGIHDWLGAEQIKQHLASEDEPQTRCKNLLDEAVNAQSNDNLSVQIIDVIQTGPLNKSSVLHHMSELPFLPPLQSGMTVDGWKVIRELHANARSEVYLVQNEETGQQAVLKSPSSNFSDDPAYIERFILEEWIGTRVQSPHIVKVIRSETRRFLYYLTDYINGPTLAQLLHERTRLPITDARNIILQVASGLRAFHRKDTLHQDIKPENIIYSPSGVKIIDFGSTYVAGIDEIETGISRENIPGTAEYSAPEYRLGMRASPRSDQFSLGVLAYKLLTGKHPYGEAFAGATRHKDFLKLTYSPAYQLNPLVPVWMDAALMRALSINPEDRYDAISEFTHDLQIPNPKYINRIALPLVDRNPLAFWKTLSGLLAAACLVLFFLLTTK